MKKIIIILAAMSLASCAMVSKSPKYEVSKCPSWKKSQPYYLVTSKRGA